MKVILDLCGGTGSWSKPYLDAGYDVRVVTLPAMDVRRFEHHGPVHGILAAPPCAMSMDEDPTIRFGSMGLMKPTIERSKNQ